MTTEASQSEFHGVRWATDRFSDGTYRAYAWSVGSEHPTPFIDVTAVDELAALDGLRSAILRHFRRPAGHAVVNDRGDRINVGGGY